MISELVRGISVMVHGEHEMKMRDSHGFGKRMHGLVQIGVITDEQAEEIMNCSRKWDSRQAHNGYHEGIMLHKKEMGKLVPSSKYIKPALESISSLAPINPQT